MEFHLPSRRDIALAAVNTFAAFTTGLLGCTNLESQLPSPKVDPTKEAIHARMAAAAATATSPSSTDRTVCGVVQPGDGIMVTLEKAGGATPHGVMSNIGSRIIVVPRDGDIQDLTFEQALQKHDVYPGDIVCDTNRPPGNAKNPFENFAK